MDVSSRRCARVGILVRVHVVCVVCREILLTFVAHFTLKGLFLLMMLLPKCDVSII